AQTPARTGQRNLTLREQVEDRGKRFRRDAHAVVTYHHVRTVLPHFQRELDLNAAIGVFAGIVEQIGKHLCQAQRVGSHEYGACGNATGQGLLAAVRERTTAVVRYAGEQGSEV